MHQNIRHFIVFFTFGLVLTSCSSSSRLSSLKIEQTAFQIKDAEIAEKGETAGAITPLEMVRVGLLIPLTGDSAKLGEALRNAALMSLFDISSQRLILQFYDTEGTQKGAREASELAIAQGVELIIGPVFSKEVRSVRPATRSEDVGVITFSSDPTNLGDNVYTISALTSQQVNHIVRFACDKGYKRFAILSQDNAVGDIVSMAAKEAVDSCGAIITKAAFYNPFTANLQASVNSIVPRVMEDLEKERDEEVKRLEDVLETVEVEALVSIKNEETGEMESVLLTKEALEEKIIALKEAEIIRDPFEFDAILISEEGSRLRSLAAMLSYYDVPSEIRVLGTSQWADSQPAREAALIGGWFSHLPSEGFTTFSQRYQALYGTKPPRIASQAYDAVALAAILAESGSFSEKNMTTVSGFRGLDGLFRLLPNGLSERGLQVLGVDKKGFVTLAPALEIFESIPEYSPQVYIEGFRKSPDLITVPLTPEEEEALRLQQEQEALEAQGLFVSQEGQGLEETQEGDSSQTRQVGQSSQSEVVSQTEQGTQKVSVFENEQNIPQSQRSGQKSPFAQPVPQSQQGQGGFHFNLKMPN